LLKLFDKDKRFTNNNIVLDKLYLNNNSMMEILNKLKSIQSNIKN